MSSGGSNCAAIGNLQETQPAGEDDVARSGARVLRRDEEGSTVESEGLNRQRMKHAMKVGAQ